MLFEAHCVQAGFIKAPLMVVCEKWKPAHEEVFEFIR